MIDYFANPSRFVKITSFIFPWLSLVVVTLFAFGIYFALFNSPEDIVQGSAVRIMYVHVPSAWLSLFSYLLLALCSFSLSFGGHPLADILSRSIAPIGAVFALLTLLTGSIWVQTKCGALGGFGMQDLLLCLSYLYFLWVTSLYQMHLKKMKRGSRPAALLAIAGSINLPIVKILC